MILTSVCRVDVALAASAVTNKGTACFGVSQVSSLQGYSPRYIDEKNWSAEDRRA